MEERRLRRVVLREELVEITGGWQTALILGQMLYWTERVRDHDEFLKEEQQRDINLAVELRYGWIYKTAEQLAEEMLGSMSRRTAARHLRALVDQEWLETRKNPHVPWDQTKQYRVNLQRLQRKLKDLGYVLPEYRAKPSPAGDLQGGECNGQLDGCSGQTDRCSGPIGQTIPEITTEITSEKNGKDEDDESRCDSSPSSDPPRRLPANERQSALHEITLRMPRQFREPGIGEKILNLIETHPALGVCSPTAITGVLRELADGLDAGRYSWDKGLPGLLRLKLDDITRSPVDWAACDGEIDARERERLLEKFRSKWEGIETALDDPPRGFWEFHGGMFPIDALLKTIAVVLHPEQVEDKTDVGLSSVAAWGRSYSREIGALEFGVVCDLARELGIKDLAGELDRLYARAAA